MNTQDIKKMMEAYLEVVSEKSCGSDRKKMEEKEVECPKCKGEGCDHCDNTGKHKVEEKKLDPVDDKENDKKFKDRKDKDIDNDGDVDDSDEYLHKRRAATDDAIDARDGKDDKKDDKKKKPAGNSGEKTAEISKIGEKATTKEDIDQLIDALTEAANPKAGATPPEGLTDKESPKSKEFAKAHDKSDKKIENDEEDGHKKTFDAASKGTKPAPKRPGDNAAGDKNVVNPVKEDTRTYQQKIMDVLSGKTWGEIANEVNELKGEE
jgi:hypothetical protein